MRQGQNGTLTDRKLLDLGAWSHDLRSSVTHIFVTLVCHEPRVTISQVLRAACHIVLSVTFTADRYISPFEKLSHPDSFSHLLWYDLVEESLKLNILWRTIISRNIKIPVHSIWFLNYDFHNGSSNVKDLLTEYHVKFPCQSHIILWDHISPDG